MAPGSLKEVFTFLRGVAILRFLSPNKFQRTSAGGTADLITPGFNPVILHPQQTQSAVRHGRYLPGGRALCMRGQWRLLPHTISAMPPAFFFDHSHSLTLGINPVVTKSIIPAKPGFSLNRKISDMQNDNGEFVIDFHSPPNRSAISHLQPHEMPSIPSRHELESGKCAGGSFNKLIL